MVGSARVPDPLSSPAGRAPTHSATGIACSRAAHAVFAEHGATASVHDIVKRAGVGVGTLYRHFPTREALVAAIFDEHIGGLVKLAQDVLDAAPGAPVLRPFLEQSVGSGGATPS